MTLANIMKRHHRDMIEDNPIEVLIWREERVESDGGFRQEEQYVGILRGRLYQETTGRSGKAALEITTPGLILRNERWGLMVPLRMRAVDPETGVPVDPEEWIDAELRDGPHVTDQFDAQGRHFEISKVWPRMDGGVTWGYVCELEEIE